MSKYDELRTYLPDFYGSLAEAAAYLTALGAKFDELHQDTMQARDNNFVFLADEATISRLEKFLYITHNPDRTVLDRKKLIVSFFVGSGKIGAKEIKDIIAVFTPSPCEVTFAESAINVRVTRDIEDTFILNDCYFILLRKIPAHLPLVITVISTFEAGIYVGGTMTQYKEEVLN